MKQCIILTLLFFIISCSKDSTGIDDNTDSKSVLVQSKLELCKENRAMI
jgi:hypothetical protein